MLQVLWPIVIGAALPSRTFQMTTQDPQTNSDDDDTPPVYGERTAPTVTDEDVKRLLEVSPDVPA